jgi:hypothetical protein
MKSLNSSRRSTRACAPIQSIELAQVQEGSLLFDESFSPLACMQALGTFRKQRHARLLHLFRLLQCVSGSPEPTMMPHMVRGTTLA